MTTPLTRRWCRKPRSSGQRCTNLPGRGGYRRALSGALSPHWITTIVIHHAGKGKEDQRATAASRGSTATTAAVSRVVQLTWVNDKDKTDNRMALTSRAGRRGLLI